MDFCFCVCLLSDIFLSMLFIEEFGGILIGGGVKFGCCEFIGEYRCFVRVDFNFMGIGIYISIFNCSFVIFCEIRSICCCYCDRVDVFILYVVFFLFVVIMC